jgi:hypothetical protein
MVRRLVITNTVGKGSQGVVCESKYDGCRVALKIDHTEVGKTERSSLVKEHEILGAETALYLGALSHENIIKCYRLITPFDPI